MLLTHFLPNEGNGTFTLNAVAVDMEGHGVMFTIDTTVVGSPSPNHHPPKYEADIGPVLMLYQNRLFPFFSF